MSDDARSMLGAVVNPGISIPVGTPSGTAGPSRRPSAGYFFPLLERGDRVLIGVQLTEPGEDVADREATGLLVIQGNLLRHCFQLQHMERNLSARAGLKRRGGGRQSLFQVERERQRLGRELHTGVGQMLAAIQLQVEIIGAQFGDPPAPVKQALGRISTLAIEALEQVRSVSKRLHPPEWQRLTLDAALEQLWEISGIPLRFQASLRIDPLPHEPALEVKVLMYRAAQEAISNMARHSRATRIDMTLRLTGERLVLTIQDNGVGFQVSAPASLASGIGLRSIREQAASLGGKLTVESSRLGTKLEVSAPFFRDDFVNPPFQKE
ncbi:MAG: sensor histidine kinase [Acidobacteriia bacterium]|nr:sensor histidine kinase [Terriglobia bacterium]